MAGVLRTIAFDANGNVPSGVYSLCTLLCRQPHQFGPALPCPKSMFRAEIVKILLQQYPPTADIRLMTSLPCRCFSVLLTPFRGNPDGHGKVPVRQYPDGRSRRVSNPENVEFAALGRWIMSNANKLFFAVALGFSLTAFAWQTKTQQTAQQSGSRDAAIHKCINPAHRDFPCAPPPGTLWFQRGP